MSYHHYYDFTATYSHPWKDATIGGEVMYGRDIFGESFWRLSGFVRYGGDSKTRDDGEVEDESYQGGANPKGSEVFADIGFNVNRVTVNLVPEIPQYNTPVAWVRTSRSAPAGRSPRTTISACARRSTRSRITC